MSKKGNRYSREFKLEALQLLESSGMSRNALENDLGISRGCLKRWREEFAEFGDSAFPGKGNERLTPEQEKIKQLEREASILRQERDILKKAIAIFSQTKR